MALPGYWEARASFPSTGNPDKVDLIFFDLYACPGVCALLTTSIEDYVLQDLGTGYTSDMVECYVNCTFTSQGTSSSAADLANDRLYAPVREASVAGKHRQLSSISIKHSSYRRCISKTRPPS